MVYITGVKCISRAQDAVDYSRLSWNGTIPILDTEGDDPVIIAETMISQSEILASPGKVSEGILLPGSTDG